MSTPIASAPRSPVFINANPATSEQSAKSAQGFGKAAISVPQIQAIDEQVITLLAKAATEQAGEVNTTKPQAPGNPELRQADMPRLMRAAQHGNPAIPGQPPKLTPEAALLMMTMMLSSVLNEENGRSLASQLEYAKARLAERAATAAELSEAIKLAEALAEQAMGDVGTAEGELAAAMEALKKAQAEVARLEQALADAPPEEQDAIRAQLEQAKAHAAAQQGHVDTAHAKLNAALTVLNGALADLEDFKAQADTLDPQQSVSARGDEKATTFRSELEYLLALLQDLMSKAELRKFAKETEFVQAVLRAREAENMRRSEEYQREVEKAEQAQKKMGCIGKVIGWVITVVAVVAAPFSGGASMALAGIGLALAVGQELGFDPLGKVLEPVMKAVMALVQEVAKVISSVLKTLGLPANVVDKIKDALAIVAVAAMVIAIAFVSKKAASNVAVQQVTKAVTKAVSDAISKALPNMLKTAGHAIKQSVDDVAGKISELSAKVIKSDTDTLAVRAGQTMKAMTGLQFANQTSQGIGSAVIADMYIDATQIKAAMQLSMVDSQILRELVQLILDYLLQSNVLVDELFKTMTTAQATRDASAKFVTSRVGHAAA